jgi:hypothetical protein
MNRFQRHSDRPLRLGQVDIGFWNYFPVSVPLTIVTLVIGTLRMWL